MLSYVFYMQAAIPIYTCMCVLNICCFVMQNLNWPPSNGFAAQLQSLRAQSGPFAPGPAPSSAAVPISAPPAPMSDIQQLQSFLTCHRQPHQQQSSALQTAQPVSLPISWEDTRQAVSQANAQSCMPVSQTGQQPKGHQGLNAGAAPNWAGPHGAAPNETAPTGATPNRSGLNGALRAGGCTGVTVSRQAQGQGQGPSQVVVQDYAPAAGGAVNQDAPKAAQQAQQGQQAQHAQQGQQAQHVQQGASWYVEQLPGGQWVCVMQDGAKLTLEQLYYTLEHVGKSLPEDKYEALSMMIKQLTDCGEKYKAQA